MYEFIRGRHGDLWNVFLDLGVESTQTIVTPRSAIRGPQASNMGQRLQQDGRIVVLGYAYAISAGDGKGFELSFRQHVGSPSSGNSVARVFVRVVGDGVTGLANTVAPIYIEGDSGAYSPLSNGSELVFTQVSGAPTHGYLHVWGLHLDGTDPAYCKLHTYSPGINYNTGSVRAGL